MLIATMKTAFDGNFSQLKLWKLKQKLYLLLRFEHGIVYTVIIVVNREEFESVYILSVSYITANLHCVCLSACFMLA